MIIVLYVIVMKVGPKAEITKNNYLDTIKKT